MSLSSGVIVMSSRDDERAALVILTEEGLLMNDSTIFSWRRNGKMMAKLNASIVGASSKWMSGRDEIGGVNVVITLKQTMVPNYTSSRLT